MTALLRMAILAACLSLLTSLPVSAQCTTDTSNPPVTTCNLQNNSNTGPTLGRFTVTIPAGAFINGDSNGPGSQTVLYTDPVTHQFVTLNTIVNGISQLTDPMLAWCFRLAARSASHAASR